MSDELRETLDGIDGVTTGSTQHGQRFFAHINKGALAPALAAIDTRHRDLDVKRVEPSGDPGNDDLFVSWEDPKFEAIETLRWAAEEALDWEEWDSSERQDIREALEAFNE